MTDTGEKFITEAELVQTFANRLKGFVRAESYTVVFELSTLNGIPDIVFAKTTDTAEAYRIAEVPPQWAYALKNIPIGETISIEEFCKRVLIQRETARKVLGSFVDSGYFVRDEGKWKKVYDPVSATEIIAIEAKLKDWKRALAQAYRYLDFANSSWVLLDSNCAKSALKKIDEFRRLNIGLASIAKNEVTSGLCVHFVPADTEPRSEIRFWAANASIAAQTALTTTSCEGV